MLGLALLQRKEYSEGVKELEKVWFGYFKSMTSGECDNP